MTIYVGDREYEPIEESGRVVGLKRFDPTFKMWVELRFDESASAIVEEELVGLLSAEYLDQVMKA